jgi:hypothetical protein
VCGLDICASGQGPAFGSCEQNNECEISGSHGGEIEDISLMGYFYNLFCDAFSVIMTM